MVVSSASTQVRRWRTTRAVAPAAATVAITPRPIHFQRRTAPYPSDVSAPIPLDDALAQARTGDLWLFRGRTVADRAIQVATNSPVNHVGLAVVVDDLPPLIWHAALDRKLVDVWSCEHVRGTQLNRLEVAVRRWHDDLGNRVWTRRIDPELGDAHELRLLETVEEMVGRGFPGSVGMARGWLAGRVRRDSGLETAYCAEVVAATMIRMGLLPASRPANWYDPGRFWSGDHLGLLDGHRHEPEVEVAVPPLIERGTPSTSGAPRSIGSRAGRGRLRWRAILRRPARRGATSRRGSTRDSPARRRRSSATAPPVGTAATG